eukprot:m.237194 g.237194  ORF g.237194 m.237194 type:complete len:441 (+) comp13098_c0_seq1:1436-2758(+)
MSLPPSTRLRRHTSLRTPTTHTSSACSMMRMPRRSRTATTPSWTPRRLHLRRTPWRLSHQCPRARRWWPRCVPSRPAMSPNRAAPRRSSTTHPPPLQSPLSMTWSPTACPLQSRRHPTTPPITSSMPRLTTRTMLLPITPASMMSPLSGRRPTSLKTRIRSNWTRIRRVRPTKSRLSWPVPTTSRSPQAGGSLRPPRSRSLPRMMPPTTALMHSKMPTSMLRLLPTPSIRTRPHPTLGRQTTATMSATTTPSPRVSRRLRQSTATMLATPTRQSPRSRRSSPCRTVKTHLQAMPRSTIRKFTQATQTTSLQTTTPTTTTQPSTSIRPLASATLPLLHLPMMLRRPLLQKTLQPRMGLRLRMALALMTAMPPLPTCTPRAICWVWAAMRRLAWSPARSALSGRWCWTSTRHHSCISYTVPRVPLYNCIVSLFMSPSPSPSL